MNTCETLKVIGMQLNRGVFPTVKNGGFVTPSDGVVPSTVGEEKINEHEARNTRASRKRSRRRKGETGRPRAARRTTPVIGPSLKTICENELDAVNHAYPGTKVWKTEGGLWLLTESSLLPELQRAAIFLTGICYARGTVRSWGFWRQSVAGVSWIGPRHTNFPDGSICAFYPLDGTWCPGQPIVDLLDIYTLWALRHYHLEVFGRWPGAQVAPHPYERMLELRGDELCGCGHETRLYRDCCLSKDLSIRRLPAAINFTLNHAGGLREPPCAIVHTVLGDAEPPEPADPRRTQ